MWHTMFSAGGRTRAQGSDDLREPGHAVVDVLGPVAPWLNVALIATLLAGCWTLVYAAGGTRTAVPHVFYIPVVLAALPFGVSGGLVTAAAAMLLCGPAMPLDTTTGEAQQLGNWLIRGGFFLTVGTLAGVSTLTLRRRVHAGLSRQLEAELDIAAASAPEPAAPGWAARISQALERETFDTVFQPIYTLDDGTLTAVEALTRFQGSATFPPDVWFQQAARLGWGIELELTTLRSALQASHDLPDEVALTFNASPDLLCDPRLLDLCDQHEDRPLVAEVTEHTVVDDYRRLLAALLGLRRRGIQLAVDDAGAGFASLRHVVRLTPDYIKLDHSLTQNIGNDPIRRPLAELLIQFADRTGSSIIVEGIETHADLATWKKLGAHAAQGYLLGRPGPLPVPSSNSRLTPRTSRFTSN